MRILSTIFFFCVFLSSHLLLAQERTKPKMGVVATTDSATTGAFSGNDSLFVNTADSAIVVNADSTQKLVKEIDTVLALPFITPKKKAMFSAIVPGLGQIYNKQYWKLPIVYGGLGFGAYQIFHKNDRYLYYRKIYAGRLSNKQEYIDMEANIPNDGIKYYQDAFRQERDLAALLTALGYGIQIIDALVFAHLKEFDISEDITLKFKPTVIPNYYAMTPTMGVGMVFQWKK